MSLQILNFINVVSNSIPYYNIKTFSYENYSKLDIFYNIKTHVEPYFIVSFMCDKDFLSFPLLTKESVQKIN